jgi:lauroyl/myristoyl acyltransferase/ADP-heptose:LPS heptosyltransferase
VFFWFLSLLGRALALLPTFAVAGFARCAGWLLFRFGGPRRRAILANLHHAFPEKSETWRHKIALESCRRTIEMGLFVVASPYFGVKRLRRMFSVEPRLAENPGAIDSPDAPEIALVPHFSLMESIPLLRAFHPAMRTGVKIGVFYRPFRNASLERWVKTTRERFGCRLLSRREGYTAASALLRDNQRVAILFDQHAGSAGSLSLFMGRLASSSELAGLLAEKHRAGVFVFYTERTGFWRGIARYERLFNAPKDAAAAAPAATDVTIAANLWLENKLRSGDSYCADWLWLHKRWKVGEDPRRRFAPATMHRDILAQNLAALHLAECPRKERFWIQLPRDAAGCLLALPLLRALRAARADAELTLLAPAALAPLLGPLGVAERVIATPRNPAARPAFFRRLRDSFPDTHVLLDDSPDAPREAWLAGAPQRFGIHRGWRSKRYLTHVWTPPVLAEARMRRPRLWELWWKSAHGLTTEPDTSTVRLRGVEAQRGNSGGGVANANAHANARALARPVIGLVIGCTCAPAKHCWPDANWRQLVAEMVQTHGAVFRVFGSPCAWQKIFRGHQAEFPAGTLENLTAQGDITVLTRAIAGCRCVIGRPHSGLLQLANLLGIPVAGFYGDENPLPNSPVFDATVITLQPPACPATGGVPLAKLPLEQALNACKTLC